ncbi:MAG TPA: TIGR03557 family F420-dependent LLM class oxidoreductase [Iamia sp.]|nr:TIGR03557 family F420-dependent LLM class oxidoreductase [Iamia sp.]
MARTGIFLSAEEHGPRDLVRFGAAAAEHGFTDISVSDHFHPWVGEQGNSPLVWSVLGGLATAAPDARLGTGVTCPTIRIHPAIVAQAAATTALMAGGGFFLGVGSGENLNEHVLGDRWPPTPVRLEMLEEAVEVMRALWTGDEVTRSGRHYTVENARIFSCPDEPPPVIVSAFGPRAAEVAARIGDGMATTSPDAEVIATYRDAGGTGPVIAFPKACWGPDEQACRRLVHRLWPNTGLPGELAQELRTPAHFEQAVELVDEEGAVGSMPCGPDPEVHAESLRTFFEAGADEVHVHQVGAEQAGMYAFYQDEVLPRL